MEEFKTLSKIKYFFLIKKLNNIAALNHDDIVVAIGIIINPVSGKKYKLIQTLIITEYKEYLKGVWVLCLAKI